MTAIVVRTFAGLRPAESPRLIRPEEAQEAVNTRLDNGELRSFRAEDPRLEGVPYEAPPTPSCLINPSVTRAPEESSDGRYLYGHTVEYDSNAAAFDPHTRTLFGLVKNGAGDLLVRAWEAAPSGLTFKHDIDLSPYWATADNLIALTNLLFDEVHRRLYVVMTAFGASSAEHRAQVNGLPIALEIDYALGSPGAVTPSYAEVAIDGLGLPSYSDGGGVAAGDGTRYGHLFIPIWNADNQTELTDRVGIAAGITGSAIIQYRMILLKESPGGDPMAFYQWSAWNENTSAVGVPYCPPEVQGSARWEDEYHYQAYGIAAGLKNWQVRAYRGSTYVQEVLPPPGWDNDTVIGSYAELVFSKSSKKLYIIRAPYVGVVDLDEATGNPLQMSHVIDLRVAWAANTAALAFAEVADNAVAAPEVGALLITVDNNQAVVAVDEDTLEVIVGPCPYGVSIQSGDLRYMYSDHAESHFALFSTVNNFVGVFSIGIGTGRAGVDGLRTIFRHGNTESDYEKWIAWVEEIEYFQTPVHEDAYDRVYWSGQDVPRYAPSQYIFDNAEVAAVELP